MVASYSFAFSSGDKHQVPFPRPCELEHSQHQEDDNNCQLQEDGTDDGLAMELEQALTHNGGDGEDELAVELDDEDELAMELEKTLSDYVEGGSED